MRRIKIRGHLSASKCAIVLPSGFLGFANLATYLTLPSRSGELGTSSTSAEHNSIFNGFGSRVMPDIPRVISVVFFIISIIISKYLFSNAS